jgi:nucleotide-binding universal stress UspA family protein
MRVLVAIDGSECSNEAVRSVSQGCWPAVTEFVVLHVSEPIYIQYTSTGFYAQSMVKAQLAYEKYMRTIVGEKATLIKSTLRDCVVDAKIAEGSAAETILAEAKRWGADLIVLGSHGRNSWERFLLGSVAQRVAAKANCSVEIVKDKKIHGRHGVEYTSATNNFPAGHV